MKKTFFNPAHLRVVRSRRIFGSSRTGHFISAAYKSDGADDTDEEKEAKEQLFKELKTRNKADMEARGWTSEFKTSVDSMIESWKGLPLEALRALTDKDNGVISKLTKLETAFEELENSKKEKGKDMSIRAQIMRYQEENKSLFDEARKAIKEERSVGQQFRLPEFQLDLRAATSPMTPANTLGGSSAGYITGYTLEPGLNDIPRLQPTFWDRLTKGRTSKPSYVTVNKTNPQGAAGFIAPGVLKPLISFETTALKFDAVKVADAAKVALELLEDVDQFEDWLKNELRYQVLIAINAKVFANPVTAGEPTGITNLAVAYTLTTIKTDNPTYADALRAVVAQMRSGYLDGEITIFINPIDSANMDMAKASTSGVYMLPPFMTANGKSIAGATIVEDQLVPVGSFLAAFLRYYKILMYKDLYISFGWENDDFRKNLLTYLCESRFIQAFNDQYTGAFVYDQFADVLAAIDAGV